MLQQCGEKKEIGVTHHVYTAHFVCCVPICCVPVHQTAGHDARNPLMELPLSGSGVWTKIASKNPTTAVPKIVVLFEKIRLILLRTSLTEGQQYDFRVFGRFPCAALARGRPASPVACLCHQPRAGAPLTN